MPRRPTSFLTRNTCFYLILLSLLHCSVVGEDFTTLTGEQVFTAVFEESGGVFSGDVLIHDDAIDEETECFTAELQSDCIPLERKFSTTICIVDTYSVVYSFQQAEYYVYESNGHVTVTLNSSRPIPEDFEVDVNTVYGIGTASGTFNFQSVRTLVQGH